MPCMCGESKCCCSETCCCPSKLCTCLNCLNVSNDEIMVLTPKSKTAPLQLINLDDTNIESKVNISRFEIEELSSSESDCEIICETLNNHPYRGKACKQEDNFKFSVNPVSNVSPGSPSCFRLTDTGLPKRSRRNRSQISQKSDASDIQELQNRTVYQSQCAFKQYMNTSSYSHSKSYKRGFEQITDTPVSSALSPLQKVRDWNISNASPVEILPQSGNNILYSDKTRTDDQSGVGITSAERTNFNSLFSGKANKHHNSSLVKMPESHSSEFPNSCVIAGEENNDNKTCSKASSINNLLYSPTESKSQRFARKNLNSLSSGNRLFRTDNNDCQPQQRSNVAFGHHAKLNELSVLPMQNHFEQNGITSTPGGSRDLNIKKTENADFTFSSPSDGDSKSQNISLLNMTDIQTSNYCEIIHEERKDRESINSASEVSLENSFFSSTNGSFPEPKRQRRSSQDIQVLQIDSSSHQSQSHNGFGRYTNVSAQSTTGLQGYRRSFEQNRITPISGDLNPEDSSSQCGSSVRYPNKEESVEQNEFDTFSLRDGFFIASSSNRNDTNATNSSLSVPEDHSSRHENCEIANDERNHTTRRNRNQRFCVNNEVDLGNQFQGNRPMFRRGRRRGRKPRRNFGYPTEHNVGKKGGLPIKKEIKKEKGFIQSGIKKEISFVKKEIKKEKF